MTELNNTNEEQVIELTKETAQEINDEYAKMAGEESVKVEDTLNKTGLKDETFEALITDPNFILSDLKKLIDKHGLFTLTDLFNFMGFNINTLKAVIYNKSIILMENNIIFQKIFQLLFLIHVPHLKLK